MIKRIIYLLFIFLTFIGFISSLEAQKRFNRGEMPPPMPLEQLNLTDAQKDKIEDLRFNHQKEMIELRAKIQQKSLELRKLENNGNFNRSKMNNLVKEINEIRNNIALKIMNHRLDIYELLDDSQKKIWSDIISPRFEGKFRDFHGYRRYHCW